MAAAARAAATRFMRRCLVMVFSRNRASQAKRARCFLGPLHSLLVVALPDLRPRTAEDVGERVLERLPRRHRRGMAVHRVALGNALHDRKRFVRVGAAEPVEVLDDAERLRERFRIVQHDLLLQTDDPASVLAWRIDLDRLELITELESSMRD